MALWGSTGRALAEATKEATKQALKVHGFAGKLGYLVAMAFA